ncbi:MAG: hypothetical protein WBC51_15015 [Vicinamibacterales bacterium]
MTAIAPVVAPLGTLVVMLVVVDDVTEAAVPLNVNSRIATEPRESQADGLLASLMPAN